MFLACERRRLTFGIGGGLRSGVDIFQSVSGSLQLQAVESFCKPIVNRPQDLQRVRISPAAEVHATQADSGPQLKRPGPSPARNFNRLDKTLLGLRLICANIRLV